MKGKKENQHHAISSAIHVTSLYNT
jgi:hypothetical protein